MDGGTSTAPRAKKSRKTLVVGVVCAVLLLAVVGAGAYYLLVFRDHTVLSADNATAEDLSDEDGDGLSLAQEVLYKTDPQNPDSDGDGYSDGDEVNSGHNPLGEGELAPQEDTKETVYNGTPLERVFDGKGSYVCNLVLDDPKLTVYATIKVKDGDRLRQELTPHFSNASQGAVDNVVLIRNANVVFMGNGTNEKGWAKLDYDPDRNIASAPGVSITGGFFVNQKEIEKAKPKRVDCAPANIDDSEFIVLPQYILSDDKVGQ